MNLPNLLSLSRIVFLFVIAALLFSSLPFATTAAFLLFIIAAITDWADGWTARKFNLITDFGKLMDALADKVLTVGLFICLLRIPNLMPFWTLFCVLVIVGREFFITGLRLVAASRGVVLAAEKGGKVKTVFQIIAICLLLLAEAVLVDFDHAGWVFQVLWWGGLATFLVATGLTVQSGWTYFSKYGYLFKEDDGQKPNNPTPSK